MKIEHIAVWVEDLDTFCGFYMKYFGADCSARYFNPKRNFTSCFLSFGEGGSRVEAMHIPGMEASAGRDTLKGLTHFALSTGSREAVDALTEWLRGDGYTVVSEPRTTGDGYYESVILDPEGNFVEITA